MAMNPQPLVDHLGLTLRACFKGTRLSPSAFDSLTKALTCVAVGLRVAHLIDVCHVGSDCARRLSAQLPQHPLCRSLVVLQFKQDYTFVCHRPTLQRHLDDTLRTPEQWDYVDIRGRQGPPVKRCCPTVLINWMQQRLLPYLTHDSSPLFLSGALPYYMVALTGWLLEYPVIYCSHDDDDDDDNETADPETMLDHELDPWQVRPNCLGDRPLCLVRVWIRPPPQPTHHDGHMLLSYTYPQELSDIAHPVSELTAKYQQRLQVAQQAAADGGGHGRALEFIHGAHVEVSHETVSLDRVAL